MFNLVLHFVDLGLEATVGDFKNACSHDVSGNSAGPAKVGLLANINVGDVLKLEC